jgi:APA family basic amino acid/polyamine antiporter
MNGVYIVSGMILISTFGCTNSTILLSARVYYAMARRGWFFNGVGEVHPRYRTPHKALIYQCAWACVLTLTGSFGLLTDLVIIAGFLFYGLIVFGVVIMRRKGRMLERGYKTPLYPFAPLVFTGFCLLLLGISLVESPGRSALGLLLIFSGLPFYYYWKRKNGPMIVEAATD